MTDNTKQFYNTWTSILEKNYTNIKMNLQMAC